MCPEHGPVAPVGHPVQASDEVLRHASDRARVPLWLPWPLPAGWLVTGVRFAGDDHTGAVASVLACSGPNPLPVEPTGERAADLLLVAEQPGVGLGAHLAGLSGLDPGATVGEGSPHLKLTAGGHDTPLWCVPGSVSASYVGEALGVWLWVLVWPEEAAAVLLEQFELRDVRDPTLVLDPPYGALSPRLGG